MAIIFKPRFINKYDSALHSENAMTTKTFNTSKVAQFYVIDYYTCAYRRLQLNTWNTDIHFKGFASPLSGPSTSLLFGLNFEFKIYTIKVVLIFVSVHWEFNANITLKFRIF